MFPAPESQPAGLACPYTCAAETSLWEGGGGSFSHPAKCCCPVATCLPEDTGLRSPSASPGLLLCHECQVALKVGGTHEVPIPRVLCVLGFAQGHRQWFGSSGSWSSHSWGAWSHPGSLLCFLFGEKTSDPPVLELLVSRPHFVNATGVTVGGEGGSGPTSSINSGCRAPDDGPELNILVTSWWPLQARRACSGQSVLLSILWSQLALLALEDFTKQTPWEM